MLAVVNGFGGLGLNNIPSRLQGLGYIRGLGSTADPSSIASQILGAIAAGSAWVNGSISRAGFRNNATYKTGFLSIGMTIETQLYAMFQGDAWKQYIDKTKCVTRYRPVNNEPYQVCGVDALADFPMDYFYAWLKFLQSPAAMNKAVELVAWKQKNDATPVTAATIAASEAEWTKRLAEHMAAMRAEETTAIQAIRDVQATIPPNYATQTPLERPPESYTTYAPEKVVTITTTPSVRVPVPEPTVMQGSPDPSGAIFADGKTVSMQANDILANIPGPSTEFAGFNIPWLLLGGVGVMVYLSTRKKGR